MISINEDEIAKAGLDLKEVTSIARRIEKAAKEAEELGIQVFGGSGSGDLRYCDGSGLGYLKLANLDGNWSGGDGADRDYGDGFIRGE